MPGKILKIWELVLETQSKNIPQGKGASTGFYCEGRFIVSQDVPEKSSRVLYVREVCPK